MAWILVLIFRLLVPLVILVSPVIGSVLGILSDMSDVVWLDLLKAESLSVHYNQFDKFLDMYLYLVMGYSATKWKNRVARNMAWGLLAFRGLGTLIYELYPARFLLLVFPNIFVWFFLFHLFSIHLFKKDFVEKSYKRAMVIVVLLAIPKVYQEYLFHVAQIPLYQMIKPWLFFLN